MLVEGGWHFKRRMKRSLSRACLCRLLPFFPIHFTMLDSTLFPQTLVRGYEFFKHKSCTKSVNEVQVHLLLLLFFLQCMQRAARTINFLDKWWVCNCKHTLSNFTRSSTCKDFGVSSFLDSHIWSEVLSTSPSLLGKSLVLIFKTTITKLLSQLGRRGFLLTAPSFRLMTISLCCVQVHFLCCPFGDAWSIFCSRPKRWCYILLVH